jgi:S1-C subfamily serine protease
MSHNPEMPLPMNSTPQLTTCSNCQSAMPSELRFCRNCGFRLGNGADSETLYFGSGSGTVSAPAKKRRKMSGMAWVFVGLLVFFVGAAAFTAVISPMRGRQARTVEKTVVRSYTGIKEWENAENGVTFQAVNPPGGPADKAGLVGGDVIVSFDGQPVQNEDQINQVLVRTAVGKTVDVQYLRDGELLSTKLTTVSEAEIQKLTREFENRPREQRARFGYDDGDSEQVQIPGTKIVGVRLDEVFPSMPADIAGIKAGDVVLQFDNVPIRTPEELLMRVHRAVPYSTVNLIVMRGEEKLEIPVKMGRQ